MVGVAKQFDGCKACRDRRVKCDKQKPFCQKCVSRGIECLGYEHEMTFVNGTQDQKGKVSLIPRRQSKRAGRTTRQQRKYKDEVQGPQFSNFKQTNLCHEFGYSNAATSETLPQQTRYVVVPIKSSIVTQIQAGRYFNLSSLEYGLEPQPLTAGDFMLTGLCLITRANNEVCEIIAGQKKSSSSSIKVQSINNHPGPGSSLTDPIRLYGVQSSSTASSDSTISDNKKTVYLFLYQTGDSLTPVATMPASSSQDTESLWMAGICWNNVLGGSSSEVQHRSPLYYQDFPNNHFFARIYRPAACSDAMSRRKSTFISDAQWCSVPWNNLQKSPLDTLMDLSVKIPALLEAVDLLSRSAQSFTKIDRALQMQVQLYELDAQFENWYDHLEVEHRSYHIDDAAPDAKNSGNIRPHAHLLYQFANGSSALLNIYFWISKIYLCEAIQRTHRITRKFELHLPVMNSATSLRSAQNMTQSSHTPIQFPQACPRVDYSSAQYMENDLPSDGFEAFYPGALEYYSQPSQYSSAAVYSTWDHNYNDLSFMDIPPFRSALLSAPNLDTYFSPDQLSSIPSSQISSFGSMGPHTPAIPCHAPNDLSSLYAPDEIQTMELSQATTSALDAQTPFNTPDTKYNVQALLNLVYNIIHAFPCALDSSISTTMHTANTAQSCPEKPRFNLACSPVRSHLNRSSSHATTPSSKVSTLQSRIGPGSLSLPESSTRPSILDEFGPDAAMSPLKKIIKVLKEQGDAHEEAAVWAYTLLNTLEQKGQEFADVIRQGSWQESSG